MQEQSMSRMFFRALFLFAAGVGVGLLAAPKTGRGSRAWIGQKADHMRALSVTAAQRVESKAKYEEGRLAGAAHRMKQLALVPEEDDDVYVDDDLITQRVRTHIGENPLTGHQPRINVDTADGIVTLRGRVSSRQERHALEEVAASVPDVTGVVNKVTVAGKRAAS